MKNINLDYQFQPFGEGVNFYSFNFPSGCEPHIKLSTNIYTRIRITCRINRTDDLIRLLLCVDALKRMGAKEVHLFMPYVPFARQDRVMIDGEPLSIKVISDLINSCGFSSVHVYDVHSDVAPALINNCIVETNHCFVKEVLKDKSNYLILSPDAGAFKKIFKVAQYIGYKHDVVVCGKSRDLNTGNITHIECSIDDFQGMDLYIIDDICDGGGTFVLLANELRKRNCGSINLIVSHGIFSKGMRLENIDHIYTTDSFKDIPNTENLTQIKLCNILI